jgi:SAM-dependent MidA family methyltransferase
MSGPSSIVEAIAAEGGRVTFARFMETALTHPTLGYYSRTERLLRHGGDFNTAPAISPFFNRTVARLVTELVDAWLASADKHRRLSVVELGGGEGHLAEGILRFWESERPELRETIGYRVVEVGAALQQTQAEAVKAFEEAGWDVGWGPDLERACAGTRPVVIVGNEFLDAIPVHLVAISGSEVREAYVRVASTSLEHTWGEVSDRAAAELELLFGTLDPGRLRTFSEDGVLELFPGVGDLMRQAAGVMSSGSFVTLDYGEWFPGPPNDAERWGLEGRTSRKRTVRGYFKHQLVLDPLARAGRQDLTADVDFAAMDLHGRRAGFETVLFTTLARFLRGGGAEEELEALRGRMTAAPYPAAPPSATAEVAELPAAAGAVEGAVAGSDPLEEDRQATVLENLLDERDLGGAFKLMVQVKE